MLLADLGGDKVRVYSYDSNTVAPIKEVDGLVTGPGVGPRHGVFRTAANGDVFFYFNGELDQNIYSYKVEYKETGLAFTKVFSIPAISADLPATKAPTSEIALTVSFNLFHCSHILHLPLLGPLQAGLPIIFWALF